MVPVSVLVVAEDSRPPAAGARPGTAVGEKGQARARDILRAARKILVESGYAALTTRRVAEAAGIRQSNVQYYFPTKTDLVRALFQETTRASTRDLDNRLTGSSRSPKQILVGSLDQFLQAHKSPEYVAFLRELWAMAAHDPAVADVMRGFYQHWVDVVTEKVQQINPDLGLRRSQRRALLIVAMMDGLSLFHGASDLDHPAVAGIEREVREVVLSMLDTTAD
jgi:AcrR family transcriptional regulator